MAEGRGSLIPMAQGGEWAGSDRKQLPKGWSCPCRRCWKLSGQNGPRALGPLFCSSALSLRAHTRARTPPISAP